MIYIYIYIYIYICVCVCLSVCVCLCVCVSICVCVCVCVSICVCVCLSVFVCINFRLFVILLSTLFPLKQSVFLSKMYSPILCVSSIYVHALPSHSVRHYSCCTPSPDLQAATAVVLWSVDAAITSSGVILAIFPASLHQHFSLLERSFKHLFIYWIAFYCWPTA